MCKRIIMILALISCFTLNCEALSAQSYALIDGPTGRLVKGYNVNQRLPMASTTKIMTGLLACESNQFDTVVTVPEEAIKVEGSSIHLVAGEKITLRDLTYGLLLESGNDAANVIAYAISGSIPGFADKMNQRASELNLSNTHFMNPSGLDDSEHYTTALDLARLGAAAMKNEEFAKIVSTYQTTIPYIGNNGGRILVNHNELLNIYDGTIGIKTGYTRRSGRCLVSCAERNGVTLVAATLNGHEDFDDHIALLDYGFHTLKIRSLFTEYPKISMNVLFGESNFVDCSYNAALTASLSEEELSRITLEIQMPKFALAPISRGQKAGEIQFQIDGFPIGETDILVSQAVDLKRPEENFLIRFWNSFHD